MTFDTIAEMKQNEQRFKNPNRWNRYMGITAPIKTYSRDCKNCMGACCIIPRTKRVKKKKYSFDLCVVCGDITNISPRMSVKELKKILYKSTKEIKRTG